jgi:hypothetical protein
MALHFIGSTARTGIKAYWPDTFLCKEVPIEGGVTNTGIRVNNRIVKLPTNRIAYIDKSMTYDFAP